MWCRCLPNAQMRALADAETYVSGEICVKCKHREQSAPRTSEHLCFCAFQSQWNLYDFDSVQQITFAKTLNEENKCRFWPDNVVNFLPLCDGRKKLSGKRTCLAVWQSSAPHHVDIIGSDLIVFSSEVDASSPAIRPPRTSKECHLFRIQNICMAELSCLMTTKPQKFRAFQAECCFQRSGLSSELVFVDCQQGRRYEI